MATVKMDNAPLQWQCRNFLRKLDEQLALAPQRKHQLLSEATTLEDLAAQLEREIGCLRPEVISSEIAAAKLHAKETRLREVHTRLEQLREQIAQLKPVDLRGANSIIECIVRHYVAHLPGKIFDVTRLISTDFGNQMALVKLSEAWLAIHRLRNWQGWIEGEQGNSSYADDLRRVLDRVLRGQLHLGADFPEDYPADAAGEAAPDVGTAAPGAPGMELVSSAGTNEGAGA